MARASAGGGGNTKRSPPSAFARCVTTSTTESCGASASAAKSLATAPMTNSGGQRERWHTGHEAQEPCLHCCDSRKTNPDADRRTAIVRNEGGTCREALVPARRAGSDPAGVLWDARPGATAIGGRAYGACLPKPALRASTIACERFSTPSLAKMLVM